MCATWSLKKSPHSSLVPPALYLLKGTAFLGFFVQYFTAVAPHYIAWRLGVLKQHVCIFSKDALESEKEIF
jgi:hypothetical protein